MKSASEGRPAGMVGAGHSHAAAAGLREGNDVNEVVSLVTRALPSEVALFSFDASAVPLSHSHQGTGCGDRDRIVEGSL